MRVPANARTSLSGAFQNIYLQVDDQIYGWGSNTKCQLSEPKCRLIDKPTVVYSGSRVSQLNVGKNFVCFLDVDRFVLMGSLKELESLIAVDAQNIQSAKTPADKVRMLAMWSSVHLSARNRVLSYGHGTHGQLLKDPAPGHITTLAVGSEHGIMCTEGKAVFCWGWGEHGNCGRLQQTGATCECGNDDEEENDGSNVVSPLNPVYEAKKDETVVSCFGGCATTWICIFNPTLVAAP
ncbi:LAMI_0F06612g1_1 [Lachancea mirantina]|uniref:LAMI_0F06612g1_1 n=1 Tax=Lachancea mirantina TaxID=1230905 RepID=A0A1G4JZ37_9SACH|nr:LAMI_0F06612g1_1 [Lachancea mirantina]